MDSRQLAFQVLRAAAHVEVPSPHLSPVVRSRDPPFCGTMLGTRLIVLEPLDLQHDRQPTGKPYEKIGLVAVINALILVWNDQAKMIVAGIADHVPRLL